MSPVEDLLDLSGELVERDGDHRASRTEGSVLVRRSLALAPGASSGVTELHLTRSWPHNTMVADVTCRTDRGRVAGRGT